ncbi:hypothetical protein SRABI118_00725 [Massilia sp. Bi118]|uniref:hypothetical protein n=1 Tax=Massilia sp. Bi118 TaxID=2822346 RepID=UPI001DCE047C|nr:hypothetical protein [Massilia sp. Bi118]CAH0159584.1 hypothetical protein SRABI118_00725 [Massilia sp. Bi118]
MSRLEKKWWFILVVSFMTAFTTRYLLDAAGLPPLRSFQPAQFAVYLFCFFGVWRGFSFLGWLIALVLSPSLVSAAGPTPPSPHP